MDRRRSLFRPEWIPDRQAVVARVGPDGDDSVRSLHFASRAPHLAHLFRYAGLVRGVQHLYPSPRVGLDLSLQLPVRRLYAGLVAVHGGAVLHRGSHTSAPAAEAHSASTLRMGPARHRGGGAHQSLLHHRTDSRQRPHPGIGADQDRDAVSHASRRAAGRTTHRPVRGGAPTPVAAGSEHTWRIVARPGCIRRPERRRSGPARRQRRPVSVSGVRHDLRRCDLLGAARSVGTLGATPLRLLLSDFATLLQHVPQSLVDLAEFEQGHRRGSTSLCLEPHRRLPHFDAHRHGPLVRSRGPHVHPGGASVPPSA